MTFKDVRWAQQPPFCCRHVHDLRPGKPGSADLQVVQRAEPALRPCCGGGGSVPGHPRRCCFHPSPHPFIHPSPHPFITLLHHSTPPGTRCPSPRMRRATTATQARAPTPTSSSCSRASGGGRWGGAQGLEACAAATAAAAAAAAAAAVEWGSQACSNVRSMLAGPDAHTHCPPLQLLPLFSHLQRLLPPRNPDCADGCLGRRQGEMLKVGEDAYPSGVNILCAMARPYARLRAVFCQAGGPSGCPLPPNHPLQTTLMDVLAGRKTGGVITGDIRVNGAPGWPMLNRHGTSCRGTGVQASAPTASALSSKPTTLPDLPCRPPQGAQHLCACQRLCGADGWVVTLSGTVVGWQSACRCLVARLVVSAFDLCPLPALPLPQTSTCRLPRCTRRCS